MNRRHDHGFALGLLCGTAVGATLGLLFAPKSGADTRNEIARSAQDLRRRAAEMYDDAAEAVEGMTERGAQVVEQGRDVIAKLGNRARGREQADAAPLG